MKAPKKPTNSESFSTPTASSRLRDTLQVDSIEKWVKAGVMSTAFHIGALMFAGDSNSGDQVPEVNVQDPNEQAPNEQAQNGSSAEVVEEISMLRTYASTFPNHIEEVEQIARQNNFVTTDPATFENYGALLRLVYEEKGAEFFDRNINPGYFYLMNEHLAGGINRRDLRSSVTELDLRLNTALAVRDGTMTLTEAVSQHMTLDELSENLQRHLANEATMSIEEKVEFYTNATTGTYLLGEANIGTILSRFNLGNCVARFQYKHTLNSVNSENKQYYLLYYGPAPGGNAHVALGHLEEDGVIRPVTGAAGAIGRPNIYSVNSAIYNSLELPVHLIEQGDTPPPASLTAAIQDISTAELQTRSTSETQLRGAGMYGDGEVAINGGTDDDTESIERLLQRSREALIRMVQNGELTDEQIRRIHNRFVQLEVEMLFGSLNLSQDTSLNSEFYYNSSTFNSSDSFGMGAVEVRLLPEHLRSLPETQAMFQRIFQHKLDLGLINLDYYISADAIIRNHPSIFFDFDPRMLSENTPEVLQEVLAYYTQSPVILNRLIDRGIIPSFFNDNLLFIYHELTPESHLKLKEQVEFFYLLEEDTPPSEIDRLYPLFLEQQYANRIALKLNTKNQYLIDTYLSDIEFSRAYYDSIEAKALLRSLYAGDLLTQDAINFLLASSNSVSVYGVTNDNEAKHFYNIILPRLIQESGVNLLDPEVHKNTILEEILKETAPADIAHDLGIYNIYNESTYLLNVRQNLTQISAHTLLSELFGKDNFKDEIRAELERRGIEFDPVIRQPIPAP